MCPAFARAPIFDESRGVLTVAPVLEQVTPAVVNIAVLARATTEENPLLKDRTRPAKAALRSWVSRPNA
jgi:serine protease DegQ